METRDTPFSTAILVGWLLLEANVVIGRASAEAIRKADDATL